MAHSPIIAELVRESFPIVLVNRIVSDTAADAVVIDNIDGARQAVSHFVCLGHSRIAYVRGVEPTTTSFDRERGFWLGLEINGIDATRGVVLDGDFTWDGARRAAGAFLRAEQKPTAALCADDGTALGFMDGLARENVRVPEECAVIGFDDIRIASYWAVSLTTIRQPVSEMTRLAMELLTRRIDNPGADHEHIVLPAKLVIRRTCGSGQARLGIPGKDVDIELEVAS